MWVATMDSEHFTWTAIGETEEEARATLTAGWEKQMRANGVTQFVEEPVDVDFEGGASMSGEKALDWYGAHFTEIALGQVAQDDHIIDTREVSA